MLDHLSKIILILAITAFAIPLFGQDTDKEKQKIITLDANSILYITYRNHRTRSEGQTGLLKINDKIKNGIKDDKMIINGIEIRHYGDEASMPWSIIGWNYADSKLIKKSWAQ